MDLIADGVLILSALVAAVYCMVLSRRLRRLMRTEGGLGEAISAMSRQADELSRALAAAKSANEESASRLHAEVAAAREAQAQLVAAMERADIAVRAADAAAHAVETARPAPAPNPFEHASPQVAPDEPRAEPAHPPSEAVGRVVPKAKVEAPQTGPGGRSLDGVISAYLDSHRDQDEESVAQRLVAALTGAAEERSRVR